MHRHVPAHVPEATTAEEAYPLRGLIPEGAWDAIDSGRLLTAAENEDVAAKLAAGGLVRPCAPRAARARRAPLVPLLRLLFLSSVRPHSLNLSPTARTCIL